MSIQVNTALFRGRANPVSYLEIMELVFIYFKRGSHRFSSCSNYWFSELMYYRKCNQFVTIFCFGDKTGNMYFSKIALFHINCYFIGKVSPMYSFLAGFSSPESIFAENNAYFLFVTKTGNM